MPFFPFFRHWSWLTICPLSAAILLLLTALVLGKPKVKVIDISITLYRETKGDIRVLYKGATNVKSVRK